MRQVPRNIFLLAAAIVLALALVPFVLMNIQAPTVKAVLDAKDVSPDGGYAYHYPISQFVKWPYVASASWPYRVPGSEIFPANATVTEDGRPLGPFDPWSDIGLSGTGTYNFSYGPLRFSTSDNTDPRTNGRVYELAFRTRLDPNLEALGILVLIAFSASLALASGWSPGRAAALAYAVPMAAVLAGFAVSVVANAMPLIYFPDSYGYLYPGLSLATGKISGISVYGRGIAYPAVIAGTLAFTTLRYLPVSQLLLSVIAVFALAWPLFRLLWPAMERLVPSESRTARVLRLAVLSLTGYFFAAVIVQFNGFVFNLNSVMAETAHVFLASAGLFFFVASWVVHKRFMRIPLAIAAVAAIYVSTLAKPMTIFTLVLAGISLAWILWRERRSVLSPASIAALLIGSVSIGVVYAGNKAAATPVSDLVGPQTLFCYHLPITMPVIGEATPQRAELSKLLQAVLDKGPDGEPIQGYNGDNCMYDRDVTDAVQRAAKSEGAQIPDWLMQHFITGVARYPVTYLGIIAHQMRFQLTHTMQDQNRSDVIQRAAIRSDWQNLAPFSSLFGMGQDDFAVKVTNHVPHDMPSVDDYAKSVAVSLAAHFFNAVILLSLILAVLFSLKGRGTETNDVERVVICTAAFVLSWVVLIAASHTYDVARYGMELVPFILLWFAVSTVYLLYAVLVRVPEYYRDRIKPARAAFGPTSEPRFD